MLKDKNRPFQSENYDKLWIFNNKKVGSRRMVVGCCICFLYFDWKMIFSMRNHSNGYNI